MNVTNVACNGGTNGSIQAVPVGGVGPYTYSWNTIPLQTTQTASNLGPGTYTVTVTDNMGCQRTATATVTQPQPLSLNMSANSINCYGQTNGTASVVVSGGTFPYTYSWNTVPVQTTATATGLVGGTYTVTVTDAHGCVQTGTTTVASPTALVASISNQVNLNCFGQTNGSATVTVTGGTPGYSYFWSTFPTQTTQTATNLPAGTYTVQVTDAHNCVTSATVTITQPPQLNAIIASQVNTSCTRRMVRQMPLQAAVLRDINIHGILFLFKQARWLQVLLTAPM